MHLSLQSELLPRLSGRQPSQHAKQGLYESYTSVVCRVCDSIYFPVYNANVYM